MKTVVKLPGQEIPESYFDVRYDILRKPLGSPKGSERLGGDDESIHCWAEVNGKIAAVGRAHLIPETGDGSAFDQKAQSACPPFEPLCDGFKGMEDDSGTEIPTTGIRPAIQVRAMGTLDEYQGQGLASKVLSALEAESIKLWDAKTGWLQARIVAIPFYEANGWCCFGAEYEVPNVGPHVSMWKNFENLKR
ncbi:MAG: GNAT family N-acetyltransferase [Flavobacteriales bacterium]|nr:GNAT family N-acetyltransferase [Flavobacteriales bacterium]